MQIGNIRNGTESFSNPQAGRVYDVEDVSPTLNTAQGALYYSGGKTMNDMIVLGRLIPDSGKIHQSQEVYATGGGCCTLKATTHKDPPKVMIEELHEKDLDKTSNGRWRHCNG